ncbi:hypothetical protein [Paenibacillus sp. y28]|uniref:hypothetical protein n=1 Tax=Paenibacillus sp. y28 TaxID=3129110 RepID=UPI003015BD3A
MRMKKWTAALAAAVLCLMLAAMPVSASWSNYELHLGGSQSYAYSPLYSGHHLLLNLYADDYKNIYGYYNTTYWTLFDNNSNVIDSGEFSFYDYMNDTGEMYTKEYYLPASDANAGFKLELDCGWGYACYSGAYLSIE